MAQEIELKLAFPASALKALLRHPLIAGASKLGRAQTLVNTYFDTPALELRRAHVALRTRKAGARWLQTIKCASTSQGGLSSRPEWEQSYRNQRFDFSSVDQEDVRKLLDRHAEGIAPVFTTEFHRETRVFEHAGTRILLMIDSGSILAAGREAPISELELELASGDPLHLLDFALQLAVTLPLIPQDASKAERGYRLSRGEAFKPVRVARSSVHAGQTPLEAFRTLAFDALFAWQANANGAQTSHEPEFIHQMRVALRRLRTLLRFFAPVLPGDFVHNWSNALGELTRQVGAARDLDVLRDHILAQPAATHAELCEGLMQHAQTVEVQARETAQAVLCDAGCGVLLLAFSRDLRTLLEPPAFRTLREFAQDTLTRQRKHARSRFAKASALGSDEAIHALRIALKRLRYGIEFFAPLFHAKPLNVSLRNLASLQEKLGYLHDLSVARATLSVWTQQDPALREASAFIAGWHAQHAAKTQRKALEHAEALLREKTPWKLLPAGKAASS